MVRPRQVGPTAACTLRLRGLGRYGPDYHNRLLGVEMLRSPWVRVRSLLSRHTYGGSLPNLGFESGPGLLSGEHVLVARAKRVQACMGMPFTDDRSREVPSSACQSPVPVDGIVVTIRGYQFSWWDREGRDPGSFTSLRICLACALEAQIVQAAESTVVELSNEGPEQAPASATLCSDHAPAPGSLEEPAGVRAHTASDPAGGAPPVDPSAERRMADRRRIAGLVAENRLQLRNVRGRWLLGDVLVLLWKSKTAMRVVRERGILLTDIAQGIEDALGGSAHLPHKGALRASAIRELQRLHKARLAFLHLAGGGQDARITVRSADARKSQARSRDHEAARESNAPPLAVGRIVWVAVEELDNGRRSTKRHPAILLALTGQRNDKWIVLTMTTEVSGDPEFRRVPEASALGLQYSGYLWHGTMKVHKSQIANPVGWVNRELIRAIDRSIGLRQTLREELEAIADLHHPSP